MRRTWFSMRPNGKAAWFQLFFVPPSRYNSRGSRSSPLTQSIVDLSSVDESRRLAAARDIYRLGRAIAGSAVSEWWADGELSALLHGPNPAITVGIAVQRDTFGHIRVANGTPRLAKVPPAQHADESEPDPGAGTSPA